MESEKNDRRAELDDLLVLQSGLPAEEVDRRIGLAYGLAGREHRVMAFYLWEAQSCGVHQLFGFRSCAQYAASRFGMSRREAHDLLAAGKALKELRQIDRAFANGKLAWTKVRELIKVAVVEHEAKWLERALALGTDELALEVRLADQGAPPRSWDDRKGLPEIRLKIEAMVSPDIYAKWESIRRRVQDDTPHPVHNADFLDACLDAMAAKLDEMAAGRLHPPIRPRYCVVIQKGADEDAPVAVQTEDGPIPLDPVTAEVCTCGADHIHPASPDHRDDRHIPDWMKRKVFARDGGRCRGCGCRLRLGHHHVVKWSEGGKTEVDNLLLLCTKCHALSHAGLLIIKKEGKSVFRLLDRQGRDIHGPEVKLKELFAELDGELIRLQLPEPPASCELEVGTACQAVHSNGHPAPRPKRFEDLVGQDAIVSELEEAVRVAREAREPLGHTLLIGGAGLGKTTIAEVIAAEIGAGLAKTNAPHLTETADLLRLLAGLRDRDILFIDEIHALSRPHAEMLYEAMEDFRMSLPRNGEVGTACHLRPFTLIGATTDPGLLPGPLLSRFENRHWIDFYEPEALAAIIERCAGRAGIEIDGGAAARLAAASRGVPREAQRLLNKARQHAKAAGRSRIEEDLAAGTLDRLGIDDLGLQPLDRAYLRTLAAHGPIGLSRAAAMLGVDARILERDHEPYLFRLGLAAVTPLGRVAINGLRIHAA